MNGLSLNLIKDLLNAFTAPLFNMGENSISLFGIVQFLLVLLGFIVVASLFKNFLKQRLLVKLRMNESDREAIATLVSYAIAALGFIMVLELSGFSLASVALIGGGLGVGIGFGLQDIAKNLISGVTILMERKLKVGDYIETEDVTGYIREIAIRSTIVRTLEGGDIVIPNNDLTASKILNWNYGSYTGCIRIPVGVAYGSDPVLVTEILLNIVYTYPTVLRDPTPKVLFIEFGENSLNFELWVWVSQIDQGIFIKSHLNFAIEYNFRQQGINIPFPQRDIWLRNPQTLNSTAIEKVNQSQESHQSTQQLSKQSSDLPLKDLLWQISYFQEYSELKIRRLIEIGYRQYLTAQEFLCKEGEPCNAFYVILAGSINLFRFREENSSTTLHTGDFFGEVSLIFNDFIYSSIQSIEETILFAVSKQNFSKLLQEYPDFAEIVIHKSSQKHEFLLERKRQLQALGLLDSAEEKQNPVVWFRNQINKFFSAN